MIKILRDFIVSIERIFLTDTVLRAITAAERQRVMMSALVMTLSVVVCLGYIPWEIHMGNLHYIPIYVVMILFALASIYIIRIGYIIFGKLLFLVPVITILFVLLTVERYETGLQFFFATACIYALAIFGYRKRLYALLICGYVILLLVINHLFEPQLIKPINLTAEYTETSFAANFITSLLSSMLIVFYLMKINFNSNDHLRQASKELRESRSRFELAIKGSDTGIWDWNNIDNRIRISPLLAELLEYDPGELSYFTMEKLWKNLHPDDLPKLRTRLRSHLKYREPFRLECRMKSKWGEYIWVLGTGQAEWDKNGRAYRIVGTILNINERKQAEKRVKEQNELLEKTNAELDRFVYSTSHDLKAPLSSILGLIHIAEIAQDENELKECLVMMKQRIHTLNSFIGDIIDYSRNSRLSTELKKIELGGLIDEIIANLEYFDQRNSIRIEKCFEDSFYLETDEGRLKIVLNNLINNAIKYHDLNKKDPYILIKADRQDKLTEIKVEDNGMGIPHDLVARIFDMFFRATEKSEGSGLGLYIAREMVKKIGGSLEVESRLGEGATFVLKLPIKEVRKSGQEVA